MTNNKQDDLAVFQQGKPYVRSILAFVFKLCRPINSVDQCYTVADDFIGRLERDIRDQ